jgi:hypothetical protein
MFIKSEQSQNNFVVNLNKAQGYTEYGLTIQFWFAEDDKISWHYDTPEDLKNELRRLEALLKLNN